MKYHCYRNRELSWLDFNKRVLEEADDTENPLCERMNFASIFKSNLDEFFMVRVGVLHDKAIFADNPKENKTHMTAMEQLSAIFERSRQLMYECDRIYGNIMSEAEQYGIKLVNFDYLTKQQSDAMEIYFNNEIKPLLSPLVVGKKHPFPFLKNKEIYAVVTLETKGSGEKIGIVPCTGNIFKRLIPILGGKETYMLAEELILHYVSKIFEHYKIKDKSLMRVIRNADIDAENAGDGEADYRTAMERVIKKRKRLCPVKLELSREINDNTVKYLRKKLNLEDERIFYPASPLDLLFIGEIRSILRDKAELFYAPKAPKMLYSGNESMIETIKEKDVLLSYPYESMRPFINLLREAANDDAVVSIKMTLYRVAKYSKVVEALIEAAENGKEVVALVELRARFDEENNIEWSKRLEESGCRLIYGLNNIKVHSKLCLITRKTENGIEYITQIGTGNYNEDTAKLYTDLSLITASKDIGVEAAMTLNNLAMGELTEETKHLLVAPKCLQNKLLDMMDAEIEKARNGQEAYIGAKVNSITDKKIINKLIEASQAGVNIELIVRGICCLIPNVKNETENIKIRSIVGRYLEHSRIYIFGAKNIKKVYISSADYMTRNTLRRVEVAAPIYDTDIKKRILDMFDVMMRDNIKAREMQSNASYVKPLRIGEEINSQEYF